MRRREFILAAGAVALASPGGTGAAEPPYRVAVLTGASPRSPSPDQAAFEERMRDLGYVEGRNLTIIFRTAAGHADALPRIAAELVEARPDAIVTVGPEATLRAVRTATDAIPIVTVAVDYDPVARGYAASLSRPGGNVTGIFAQQIELAPKRLELLSQAIPSAKRIGVLADEFTADQLQAVGVQAARFGLVLGPVQLRNAPYDFAPAISELREFHADAVLTLMSPVFFRQRVDLADALLNARLPASFGLREFPEAGGLMSYGANLADMRRRAADFIDRLFKGATPGDRPIEQPTKFEMAINLKTAQALGLTIPATLLAGADEVIE